MEIKDVFEITILFILLICFIIWILFTLHSIRLSNRVKSQTVKLNNKDNDSYLDKLFSWYTSEKDRYIRSYTKDKSKNSVNKKRLSSFIDKLTYMLILMIIYLLLSLFYLNIPTLIRLTTVMILGYLIPTFIEVFNRNYRRRLIDKELLKSISLINSNLQSGKSIKEAIEATSNKLDGPLKEELNEVVNDLDHGLSLQVAFDRMKKRTKSNDIIYLTTSLSIISKTGGNIIEMFDYLENLFQIRKDLDLELESTIASSKLVFIILSILPIIMFLGMNIIYENFMSLFINNALGNLLGMLIVSLYFIYIVCIIRMIKIEKY